LHHKRGLSSRAYGKKSPLCFEAAKRFDIPRYDFSTLCHRAVKIDAQQIAVIYSHSLSLSLGFRFIYHITFLRRGQPAEAKKKKFQKSPHND
jgi:hypothetical protein